MNLSRIKALGPWLAEGKYVWIALATNLSALIVSFLLGTSEAVFRITGLLLQVFGILTIAWGISETRALFGHASLAAKIKAWFQRFPLCRRHIVFAVGRGDFAATTGKARAFVTHGAGQNPTLDARVGALEKNIVSIQNHITGVEAELDEGFARVSDEIRSEGQTREANDKKLGEKIEASATGGIHISAFGASWLFVGVILSTAAPELAAMRHNIFCPQLPDKRGVIRNAF
ncbi:MAG: hypothetical protein ACREFF_15470 [Candidatus Udaeobacter sp.]